MRSRVRAWSWAVMKIIGIPPVATPPPVTPDVDRGLFLGESHESEYRFLLTDYLSAAFQLECACDCVLLMGLFRGGEARNKTCTVSRPPRPIQPALGRGAPYDFRPLFFRPCFISCRVAASSTE